jgi:hypothetical protein
MSTLFTILGLVCLGEAADWWDAVDVTTTRYTADEVAATAALIFFGVAFIAWIVETIADAIKERRS